MPATVRPAGPGDLDAVVEGRLRFLAASRGPEVRGDAGFAELTRAFLAREAEGGRLRSWLAEDGSGRVGLVSLLLWARPPQPEDRRTTEAYVVHLYVEPAHRRRGIGGRLLDAGLAAARELGVRKVLLHATDDGRLLYEARGFAPKGNWMELPLVATDEFRPLDRSDPP